MNMSVSDAFVVYVEKFYLEDGWSFAASVM